MSDTIELVDQTPDEFLGEEFDLGNAISFLMDLNIITDTADDYGEPGYSLDNPNGFFAIGDWWCPGSYDRPGQECDYHKDEHGKTKFHAIDVHYKTLFEKLGEAGMETAFYDEWTMVYGVQLGEYPNIETKTLAYRTTSDSYHWKSSLMWDEEAGEYLTPHDGIKEWIEVCLRQGQGMSGPWSEADLEEHGFEEYNCNYENGFFEGMNDDPSKIMAELKERFGKTHDILPYLKENSQFYYKFCVFLRERKITIGEVAELYGVTDRTIRRWADKGLIPCTVSEGGTRKFKREDFFPLPDVKENK